MGRRTGRPATVVTFAHEKGGQGKTSAVSAFAYGLDRRGYRVLCIDYDAQGSLSSILGVKEEGQEDVYEWVIDGRDVRRSHGGIDVVPASLDGVRSMESDMTMDPAAAVFGLADAIARVDGEYDFVLIDTASAISTALNSALSATDYVVVPTEATVYGLDGLARLKSAIDHVRRANPAIAVAGVFLNKYRPRVNDQRARAGEIRAACEAYGYPVFATTVRESANISTASGDHADPLRHRTRPPAAGEFDALVDEFLGEVSRHG